MAQKTKQKEIGDLKSIFIKAGYSAIVDDDDYEKLVTCKWCVHRNPLSGLCYAYTVKKCKLVYMHRIIMQTPSGMHTDHINGNGLDNRKVNLRVCTNAQNQANYRTVRGQSQYRGVYRVRGGAWRAQTRHMGKKIYIGTFKTELEAAVAYEKKIKELKGEFAKTILI